VEDVPRDVVAVVYMTTHIQAYWRLAIYHPVPLAYLAPLVADLWQRIRDAPRPLVPALMSPAASGELATSPRLAVRLSRLALCFVYCRTEVHSSCVTRDLMMWLASQAWTFARAEADLSRSSRWAHGLAALRAPSGLS